MKKILIIISLTLLLISCGQEGLESGTGSTNTGELSSQSGSSTGTGEKKDFLLEVKKISEFKNETNIIKSGKISSTQDIPVTSQVRGRVSAVYKKEGDYVRQGQAIVVISDNIANYGLQLSSAKNNLEKAKLNYDSNKIKLDKAIVDIERNISNTQIDNDGSQSSLELVKIDNSIRKLGIDYDNLKISNQEQIKSFINSFNSSVTNFEVYAEDIIDFSNDILGVDRTRNNDDIDFERYIGAKNTVQLNETKDLLRELIDYKDNELVNINFSVGNEGDLNNNIQLIIEGFELIDNFLTEFDEVFDNSIWSLGTLSQQDIAGFKSQVSGFFGTYNQLNSSFINLKNSSSSFLETYLNSEESLLKQIGLLEQDKKIFIQSLDFQIDSTNATLDEAKQNRDLTLKNLELLITDAEIGYQQALNEYNKLTISSPINGIISNIGVDVGQEIGAGTPVVSVLNNSDNLVNISFTKDELSKVKVGNKVKVLYLDEEFDGIIYSISQTADTNLRYKSEVKITESVNLLGSIVTVNIPIQVTHKLIPLNIVTIGLNGSGQLNTYVDGEIQKLDVVLGKIYDDMIELVGEYDQDINIISNYIDNYDENKFNLKISETNE